jgi:ribosome-interacting GTPase 1
MTKLSEREIQATLNQYGMFNADVVVHQDITVDEFIDSVEGNRAYVPAIYVLTKSDLVKTPPKLPFQYIPIAAEGGKGIEELKKQVYQKLDLIHIFTKRKGEAADLEEPMIVRRGITVGQVCEKLHRDLRKDFRYGLVWGKSVKHQPQRVGFDHVMADRDILQIIKR